MVYRVRGILPSLAGAVAAFGIALAQDGYRAPASGDDLNAWPKGEAGFSYLAPSDPASPRSFLGTVEEGYDVRDPEQVLAGLKDSGMFEGVSDLAIEPIEVWESFNGDDTVAFMARTTRGGEPAVLFVLNVKPRGGSRSMVGFEVTQDTFEDWGGILRFAALSGLLAPEVIGQLDFAGELARQPFATQLRVYEEFAGRKLVEVRIGQHVGMSAMQQTNALDQIWNEMISGPEIQGVPTPFD